MLDSPLTMESAPTPFPRSCAQCQHDNESGTRFCENCGAPVDDDFFDAFHAPALAKARKWMGAVAIMYIVGGLLMAGVTWMADATTAIGILVINLALAATQGGLWWWSKRAVFPAAVVSLTLYLVVILIDAIADPMTLARGWLIKIAFISALTKAIQAGLEVKRLQSEAQKR